MIGLRIAGWSVTMTGNQASLPLLLFQRMRRSLSSARCHSTKEAGPAHAVIQLRGLSLKRWTSHWTIGCKTGG